MEANYRGLLEASPDAVVVVNQAGEIIFLNVQSARQFGYRGAELLGQRVHKILPELFAEWAIADGMRNAVAQQNCIKIESCGRRRDGTEFPIEIMLSALESPDGALLTAA